MSLSLHTIKPATGSAKRKKRIGRGNASGHGTYSTRGLKGQKSRSGVSGLVLKGMKKLLSTIPKKRGFKSDKEKNQVINIFDLNKNFKDGDKINPRTLAKAGLIDTITSPVKLLGVGNLTLNNLEFSNIKTSASVKLQIESKKGKIVS